MQRKARPRKMEPRMCLFLRKKKVIAREKAMAGASSIAI